MAKIALLIGVSEYKLGLNPLPAAVRDVEALQKVLLNPAIGGFAESDVVVLKNPDRQTMEEAIETLFTGRSRDDLVLLFFSGHGIKDDAGKLFLATCGTRKTPQGELIRATAVQSSFIQDSMSRSRSKRQVVILDSCFSGAFAEGLLAKDDGTIDIRSQLGGEGRAILTSSSSTQYSFEHEGSELSLYTRFLIEGIETGAADADEDEVVSIDELHEYASRKVKEIKPELKPQIFAIREGFKIHLTKIPAIDPQQKYRREVARFMNYRGEISSINRRTLNIIKNRLQLDETDAQAIEHEVLEPTRIKFTEHLQVYELAFSDVIQKNENLSDSNREDLGQLQKILELRDEDTRAIETKVKAQLQAYRQHLQEYEEVFRQALRLEYPLSDSKRVELQQVQQKLTLKEADIESIEAKVTAEMEAYYRHLEQYKQLFIEVTNQEYPLSDAKRYELLQQQERLDLSDLDVSSIEAEITTEIETYQQKLEQYQQAFVSATQAKYLPTSPIRKQLQQTWQTLGLTEADVIAIESPIIAQINLYQQNLEQYEKEFDNAVQQQYPLSEAKRNELTQLKLTLNLNDDDVTTIESPIKAAITEHLDKLQQYKEAFLEAIEDELPLTEETRQDLKRFQQILEVSNEDVEKIEAQIILSKTNASQLTNELESTENQNIELLETLSGLCAEETLSAIPLPPVQPGYRKDLVNPQSSLSLEFIKILARRSPEEMVTCPNCQAKVKAKNLVSHFDRVHKEIQSEWWEQYEVPDKNNEDEWWEQYEVPDENDEDEWWEQYEVPDKNNEFKFIVGQTIYIGNLSLEITKEDLKEVFSDYGKVEQVYLPLNSVTGRKRDFAFIAMLTKEQTATAAETLDGAEWMGRELTVRIAKPNEVTNLEPD
jgi:uncharacterized caspase-like protein